MHTTTMKWCARVGLALMSLGAAATAQAAPIDYTMSFTLLDGTPAPIAGSFTYDADAPLFSNFYLSWNGATLDLTAAANRPFDSTSDCRETARGAALGFAILSGATACATDQIWEAGTVDRFGVMTSQFVLYSSGTPFSGDIGRLIPDVMILWLDSTPGSPAARAGGTFTIAPAPTPVPEPASLVLLGTGLLGTAVLRRTRGSRSRTS